MTNWWNNTHHRARDAVTTKEPEQVYSHPAPRCNLFQCIRYEHLLAGMSGGVVSTMILHPLDTLRTRLSVSNGKTSRIRPHYNGLADALSSIRRTEGFRGLYRGVGLNVLSAGCAWGSYFFLWTVVFYICPISFECFNSYDAIKVELQHRDPTCPLGPAKHMLAACEAGIITLILTNPITVVKTRLCLQFGDSMHHISDSKRYKNVTDALVKTYHYEGLKGLYKGFVPGLFGVSHGALQFMMYEEMKNAYHAHLHQSIDTTLNTAVYLGFAALSKLISATATYPYQLMRTRMQDHFEEYKGTWDVASQTWRYEGIRGFYKGLVPSLLRVTPATAITFVVYEKVSRALTHLLKETTMPSSVDHHDDQVSSSLIADVPLHRIHGPSA